MPTRMNAVIIIFFAFILACESVQYVKDELSGDAKPEGSVQENIPPTMTFNAMPQSLRKAVMEVLEEPIARRHAQIV